MLHMHICSQHYPPPPTTLEQLSVFQAEEQMCFVIYNRQYSDVRWWKIKAPLSNSLMLIDIIYKDNKKK